jgi:transcriptional regulator with XRE-family HTH domain
MNTIGNNIKRLRQKMGWSQGQAAKNLNISIPAFSKIETGLTEINIKRLHQIADLFKVSTVDILSEQHEHPMLLDSEKINKLKADISEKEREIIKLQKRIIELFEELEKK